MSNRGSDARKRKAIRERKCRREEEWTISFVGLFIEGRISRENSGDVVIVSGVVERVSTGDGHVLAVPCVGEVQGGRHNPEEEHEAGCYVCLSPPRGGEGRANVGDLCPIKCQKLGTSSVVYTRRERTVEGSPPYQDHGSHRRVGSRQRCRGRSSTLNVALAHIIRFQTRRRTPRKVAEGTEKVIWEQVPECGAGESDVEELFTAVASAVTNTRVLGCMEGVEERAGNEIGRPDHGRGLDQEASRNTANGEPNQLSGHDHQPLKAEIVRLAERVLVDG